MNGNKLRSVFLKHADEVDDAQEEANDIESDAKANLTKILAHMRAASMHYQHAHWQTEGETFYGDHLMYGRLYDSLDPHIDTLAEKIVGYYGTDALSTIEQTKQVAEIASEYCEDCFIKTSLAFEEALCNAIVTEFDRQEEAGTLKLGMNDFLAAACNDRDTAKYLLKQRLK